MVRPSLPLKSIAGAGRVPFGWQKPRQWILFGRWFAQKSAKEASLIVPEERDFIAYTQARKEAVENLKKNSQTDPYPHKYHTTHSIGDLVREFDEKCGGISAFSSDIRVSFGGRVERIRKAGAHLLFLDVRAD
jgi:lysyl-tRNA synthetase class 2